jgi:tRNA A-37 threonylcarbamoyl transferase component Bud32
MTVTPSPPESLREALADRYQLQREIGRGGMATVYLATDIKHRRVVAVKVLKPDLAASLGADRFLQEIEIAAQLNHPHILPLLDSADIEGTLLYVMPYVDGESLRGLLDRTGPLSVERAMAIATEVAGALTYAHEHGVVHRDIKPENILLNAGHAVVADFGIAKALSSLGGRALTRTGFPIGTPGYMSPEQAAGIAELDARSDVFSLGCVVYEMLVGDTPRFWLSEEAVRLKRFLDAPDDHQARLNALPDGMQQALVGALTLSPQNRLASPADFMSVLRERPDEARRRYSDSEVQDIVKRASEAEARPTDDGMTIGGVQALGAEVGIAADEMARAAQAARAAPALPALQPAQLPGVATLLGGPLSVHRRYELTSSVELHEQVDLLHVIREVMGQGRAADVMGSLEWRGGVEGNVTVTVSQRRDDVRVDVIADRSLAAFVSYGVALVVFLGPAIVLVNAEQPGTLGMLALLGTGATIGLAVGRTAFIATGRLLDRKLKRLRDKLRGYLER